MLYDVILLFKNISSYKYALRRYKAAFNSKKLVSRCLTFSFDASRNNGMNIFSGNDEHNHEYHFEVKDIFNDFLLLFSLFQNKSKREKKKKKERKEI